MSMQTRLIKLCYRKIIDNNSAGAWEKFVFDDTYTEFLMQSQLYNQEKNFTSFGEIIQQVPNADKLHYLVSSAAINYLKQLSGRIPDILNTLGKLFLPFENFRFEIINSDIKDKTKHEVAINFYTPELIWIDTIGSQLLISIQQASENEEILTEQFSMQPYLSIYSIKETHNVR